MKLEKFSLKSERWPTRQGNGKEFKARDM